VAGCTCHEINRHFRAQTWGSSAMEVDALCHKKQVRSRTLNLSTFDAHLSQDGVVSTIKRKPVIVCCLTLRRVWGYLFVSCQSP